MGWVVDIVEASADLPFGLLLLVAGALAFAESGLAVGSLIPGETAVLILGTASTGLARFVTMLLVVGLGVTAGDHVGYFIGRRYGTRLRETRVVERHGARHWDRSMAALERHGAAAVFLTRLVPVVRTLTPAAAGASRLAYPRFLPASLAGALLWSSLYVGLGAFTGASLHQLEQTLGNAGWLLLAALAAATLTILLIRRRGTR